ncbi:MAG: hypothetical protein ACM3H7_00035, partial [Acidobacteriaceae bacterium]
MAGIKDLSSVWKNIKEIDLKPIRDAATQPVRIALVGDPGSGRHALSEQLHSDPSRPEIHTQSPLAILDADVSSEVPVMHLIVLMADASRSEFSNEQLLVKKWAEAGRNVLVLLNQIDVVAEDTSSSLAIGWPAHKVLVGSVNDIEFIQREFVPAVLELLPQLHLALGRQFPLFRLPVARQLITDTCFSNAAYSLSTGLAEIVPVLDLPLNVTDMIVLTKSQAFLAYKLGLLVGFSTRWQDYVSEFGSVIGGGFVWRQIARQLVGLIPAWGIIPKVAVAYSGTYVVGNAILSWYLTGRHLSAKQMRALSKQSFSRGKELALKLAEKLPRPRLGRGKKARQLPATQESGAYPGEIIISTDSRQLAATAASETGVVQEGTQSADVPSGTSGVKVRRGSILRSIRRLRKPVLEPKGKPDTEAQNTRICPECGKSSSAEASF